MTHHTVATDSGWTLVYCWNSDASFETDLLLLQPHGERVQVSHWLQCTAFPLQSLHAIFLGHTAASRGGMTERVIVAIADVWHSWGIFSLIVLAATVWATLLRAAATLLITSRRRFDSTQSHRYFKVWKWKKMKPLIFTETIQSHATQRRHSHQR